MGYDSNIYYNPEKFGLTPVGEIEWTEPCYSFDTTAIWRRDDGKLYWASDQGCSCPSPFDWLGLDECATGTKHDLDAALRAELGERYFGSDSERQQAEAQIADVMAKVMAPV